MQTYINMIPFLFRYIRSGHMEDAIDWESIVDNVILDFQPTEMIKDDAMELRADEDYVSFFWSYYEDDSNKILHTLNELKARRNNNKFSARCAMLKVDAKQAMIDINDVDEMIEFRCTDEAPKGCIHHGLFYLVEDTLSMLEIRSSIIEKSSFFAIKKIDANTRELLGVDQTNRVKTLGDIRDIWQNTIK